MSDRPGFLPADWPAPANVGALVTTRSGGVSAAPFDSFNLALHVEDNPADVELNRAKLLSLLEIKEGVQWLQQVHGNQVVEAVPATRFSTPGADAAVTSQKRLPCAVMTADCLPVFFCTLAGDRVGVAHAGWRGLASGVLENTIAGMGGHPNQLLAWLGPAIGPLAFEVGSEVRDAFLGFSKQAAAAFRENTQRPGHWFADLYRLARLRLQACGVEHIYGGGMCTYEDRERFYSYRRDRVTGRMASVIWLR